MKYRGHSLPRIVRQYQPSWPSANKPPKLDTSSTKLDSSHSVTPAWTASCPSLSFAVVAWVFSWPLVLCHRRLRIRLVARLDSCVATRRSEINRRVRRATTAGVCQHFDLSDTPRPRACPTTLLRVRHASAAGLARRVRLVRRLEACRTKIPEACAGYRCTHIALPRGHSHARRHHRMNGTNILTKS